MKKYSPLLRREAECIVIRSIPATDIRAAYKAEFGYDPEGEFNGIEEVHLVECTETGLRFFLPVSCAGREGLYRQLQTFDWNYKEKKWEHDVALNFVSAGMSVLDVGCGRAAFLNRALHDRLARVTGLEFNDSAAEFGRQRGVEVRTETVQEHAAIRPDAYDMVTSFQVLEHVTDPAGFIEGCIATLRPGGTLLLGVPNNDGFLGLLDDNWLNMPPHHMSLWSRACLEGLPKLFPISHVNTFTEPLQERAWYKAVFERRHMKGRLKRFIYYKFGMDAVFKGYIDDSSESIPGHTIMASYIKRPT